MRTTSVSDLKARLAHYLRQARRGGEVQILERGVPIARLVACTGTVPLGDKERLERLAREGVLRPGAHSLSWLLAEPPVVADEAQLTDAVLDDRNDRV